jgi:hypothetical protein
MVLLSSTIYSDRERTRPQIASSLWHSLVGRMSEQDHYLQSVRLCPVPCSPNYIPIVPQSRLGSTGFVHWRIDLTGVSATTWSDPENGAGPTTTNIPLGPSFAESSSSSPLAVLDSGGVQILVSRRSYADSIYSAFGVTASSDGLCESPGSLFLIVADA